MHRIDPNRDVVNWRGKESHNTYGFQVACRTNRAFNRC